MLRNFCAKSMIVIVTMVFGGGAFAQTSDYKIDVQKSKIAWHAKKVTGQHHGTIQVKGGILTLEGKKIVGGEFEIDMTTITVVDLQDPKANAKLTNHLKSDDFFSIEEFPSGKFVITNVEAKGKDQVEVTGNLTLKGITHPIEIPAKLVHGKNTIQAIGEVKLDRTKWNVRYGSGKFFKGLGDKLIYDEFLLKLDLVAAK